MIKNPYISFGLFVILVVAFWNLFDFLYSTVITRSGYQFDIRTDLFIPLVVGVIMGAYQFLRKKE